MARNSFGKSLALIMMVLPAAQASADASFDWFTYEAADSTPAQPENTFSNPILPGFYPDPSITRKDDTYYLVNSSFAFTPGLPIFKSQDLVHWEQIGHALNKASQADFSGLRTSRGIFAPTIRYHDGLFYIITTAVDAGGNFIITAKDPAGPWSDPVWLPEVGGIDPDLFIDNDGRAYIAHNDAPPGEPEYDGHRAVWMWELDLATLKIKPNTRQLLINGGVDISTKPVWIEGPHIYHKDGWYYLTCAEGGTSVNHSQVVFRTKSLSEPFVPFENNPILTQRDRPELDITSTGHADFIQTPEGDWWSVFLATRPYQGNHYNTGRETFILPLNWEDGWPTILPAGEPVPTTLPLPKGVTSEAETFAQKSRRFHDDFTHTTPDQQWLALNTFERNWLKVSDSLLTLSPITETLTDPAQSAFIGKRQQHMVFSSATQLDDISANTIAGLVVFQNRHFHYFIGVEPQKEGYTVFLEKVEEGTVSRVATKQFSGKARDIELRVTGDGDSLNFFVADKTGQYPMGDTQPATLVSTQTAGGFVGALIGLHARKATP
ncbi:glycoside hydrolase family 43 protein [Salinimonas sp. HHU 13199]|uniref:Glycoside hydrolase family 43 protein n=1 Tax=Salinimonas profundi TaxID=2729140 RepID=A0ABR8LMR8_9ALTE|nr:glycoside hydrolase family 43 protein [Salinimonas profundi]MBD3587492.1 glycoside hydrolase family 43 protein [Salinimonas profundi]